MAAVRSSRYLRRIANVRFMSAEAKAEIHPSYFKLKETQREFQVDNGRLIHERFGTTGKLLYNLNKLLLVAAAICESEWLYRQIFPKK
mmetsp:Transcript_75752/g.125086  ORF Transcript_75752/g.125086 Transcript_75752/m.125086 type:complete len:88 (-) Transcript_75752:53-316(-)